MYTVSVTGVVIDPTMGMGLTGTERVMADDTADPAVPYASGNDKLTGTDAAETINGLSGDDSLYGLGGDDVLNGGDDNDLLVGGYGADMLTGGDHGEKGDTLSYEHSDDWVRITLNDTGAATASRGHASGDMATNFENVTGSASHDDLTGNVNNNILKGLAGDDDIDGAGGNDTIEGGAGDDKLDGGYSDGGTPAQGRFRRGNPFGLAPVLFLPSFL
ncbi:MAG: hypothetical protein OXE42_03670 [Gammaproteobacteria bacterium]|nr:hypothetical protein [Gammaproteobacteria bacterium]